MISPLINNHLREIKETILDRIQSERVTKVIEFMDHCDLSAILPFNSRTYEWYRSAWLDPMNTH